MPLLVSIFFGFVPMFLFAGFINWLDRYEKEPKILLGAAFMWGVVIAGGGAYIINTVMGLGVYIVTGSESATDFATASIIPSVPQGVRLGSGRHYLRGHYRAGLRRHRERALYL